MTDTPQHPRSPRDLDDDRLLARLGEVLDRVDAPPPWLEDLAKLSFDLRSVDAELAELVADSRTEQSLTAVRSAALAEPYLLSFETPELAVDLEVTAGPHGTCTLVGQLTPAQQATVTVRQPGRPNRVVEADDLGRFLVPDLRPGPFSLVCDRPGQRPVVSSWVTPG